MTIGIYRYGYGNVSKANREIEFIRISGNNIEAKIYVYDPIKGKNKNALVSTVRGDCIFVEKESTSEKVKSLYSAKSALNNLGINKTDLIVNLDAKKQDENIQKLEPNGPKRIEIINDIGGKYERVARITIFDPS